MQDVCSCSTKVTEKSKLNSNLTLKTIETTLRNYQNRIFVHDKEIS